MSKQEQKLFFTRENYYTLWEMLNHLDSKTNNDLFLFSMGKHWIDAAPASLEMYPNSFYRMYRQIDDEQKTLFIKKLKELFNTLEKPKTDFHTVLYQFNGNILPLEEVHNNLCTIKEKLDIKIDDLSVTFQIKSTIDQTPVIDIRFSSLKTEHYKGNETVRKIHTEVRIYPEIQLALLTNYNDFTHSESVKKDFIKKAINCIISSQHTVEPTVLKDQSLRSLLLLKDVNPSKMKFDVDGRLQVGIRIMHSQNTKSAIDQDEVKRFYNKYEISHITVTISEEEDKYIYIDGINGKLMSKNKNLQPTDIDKFIYQLKTLLKYDYLYINYKNDLMSLAKKRLTATGSTLKVNVETCIKEIKEKIQKVTQDNTKMFDIVIENVFFSCLIKGNPFNYSETKDFDYTFSTHESRYLCKIFDTQLSTLENHLKAIFFIFDEHKESIEIFLSKIDEKMNVIGMVPNDIGA
ncbi:hypothetical protein SAMN04487777_12724 [Priestia aryabhattai B8W22]|uniref:hypothetical protein n=1 Tax=Priestia aryabhattai TaxID=412384 RepID=UPI00087E9E9D|nr:hypothetical protein SAMN04487777_12724 [Priestia aryabhattai B8W22]